MNDVLNLLLSAENFTLIKTLSVKPTAIVALVQDGDRQTSVVRLSPYHEEEQHPAVHFIEYWTPQQQRFLPRMEMPDVFTVVHDDGSRAYYVLEQTEYVGKDLIDFLNETMRSPYWRHLEKKTFEYLFEAISGLNELHAQGWYHLDFSMENIVVSGSRAALIDFEGALHIEGFQKFAHQSQIKTQKPDFIAPEVSSSHNSFVVPADIDVWAVGVTLFQAITHKYLFDAKNVIKSNGGFPALHAKYQYLIDHGFEQFVEHYFPPKDSKVLSQLRSRPGAIDLFDKIFVVYMPKVDSRGNTLYFQDSTGRSRISMGDILTHDFFVGRERTTVKAEAIRENQLSPDDLVIE